MGAESSGPQAEHWTHSVGQRVLVRVVWRRALLDLLEQQRVLDQAAAGQVQEVPQVQLPAERRLLAQAQEVLHSLLVLLLVQQSFGSHLVAAVGDVGLQAGELRQRRSRGSQRSKDSTYWRRTSGSSRWGNSPSS